MVLDSGAKYSRLYTYWVITLGIGARAGCKLCALGFSLVQDGSRFIKNYVRK